MNFTDLFRSKYDPLFHCPKYTIKKIPPNYSVQIINSRYLYREVPSRKKKLHWPQFFNRNGAKYCRIQPCLQMKLYSTTHINIRIPIVWFHQIILKRIQYYIKVKTILMLSTNTFSNT